VHPWFHHLIRDNQSETTELEPRSFGSSPKQPHSREMPVSIPRKSYRKHQPDNHIETRLRKKKETVSDVQKALLRMSMRSKMMTAEWIWKSDALT
jgi:hypothetical protein